MTKKGLATIVPNWSGASTKTWAWIWTQNAPSARSISALEKPLLAQVFSTNMRGLASLPTIFIIPHTWTETLY